MNELSEAINGVSESLCRLGKEMGKFAQTLVEPLLDLVNCLEPYQRYELAHPKKKPRGSIRRKRRIRGYTAKDGYEIGKSIYKGMMEGFGIEEDKEC